MGMIALLYLFFNFLMFFTLVSYDGAVAWLGVDGFCSIYFFSSSGYTLEGGDV